MSINSFRYAAVIIAILLLYFVLQKTEKQKYVVALANVLVVYLCSGISGVIISLIIVTSTFFTGKSIDKSLKEKNTKATKGFLTLGVGVNLTILLYFKYFLFTAENINEYLNFGIKFMAPVGLAYFSLSLTHYLLDVYHKKYTSEKNYIDFLAFSLFFPSIVEGPFGFYKKLSPQLKVNHKFDWDRMVSGLQRILWGYFKKLVIADRIGIEVMGILGNEESAGFLLFMAMVFYSFQIYADFSGGIDVVMGISEIMGIELYENFRSPLISRNVTEYWARWHMSLGEWMEKVIYYPIVLNRKMLKMSKKIKHNYLSKAFSATVASVIVFIVVGIWHGTGWNYVVYGLYQALFVSSAVLLKPSYANIKGKLGIREEDFGWHFFQVLRTFVILVFGRYLIKSKDLSQAIELIRKTFSVWNPQVFFDGTLLEQGLDFRNFYLMLAMIVLLYVVDICHNKGFRFRKTLMECNIIFRYAVYMVAIFMIIILGIYGKGYDASSFIYANF